jgi:glycosyltransferase involved in cell wall biosynthesis
MLRGERMRADRGARREIPQAATSTRVENRSLPMTSSSRTPTLERKACAQVSARGGILVIGPFPPPVHGFAQATEDFANLLGSRGFDVMKIDLKPIHHKVGILGALRLRMSQLTTLFSKANRGSQIYLALSGGGRQLVDIVVLVVARISGAKLYIHHHSFAYLDQPTSLSQLCFRVAGKTATHLVLCSKMKRSMQKEYKSAVNVEVISNAGLRSVGFAFKPRTKLQNVGYLGALTREKGILMFLEVAEYLLKSNSGLTFSIAGPCDDKAIRDRVERACQAHLEIDYLGPVYGERKKAFVESLDALLFPTTYHNEAEPLVIWESISNGAPVVGWERGCIGEMLAADTDIQPAAIPKDSPFAQKATDKIQTWIVSPESFRQESQRLRRQFERVSAQSLATFDRVFSSDTAGTTNQIGL